VKVQIKMKKMRIQKRIAAAAAALLAAALFAAAVHVFSLFSQEGSDGAISVAITSERGQDARPALTFVRGDIFDLTVSIDGSTGFTGMMLRLGLPPGIELVGLRLHALPNIGDGFTFNIGGSQVGGDIANWAGGEAEPFFPIVPPLTGNIFAGWAGRSENFTGYGALLTYRLRVRADVLPNPGGAPVQLGPVTLAFANAIGTDVPTDLHGRRLQISLPVDSIGAIRYSISIADICATCGGERPCVCDEIAVLKTDFRERIGEAEAIRAEISFSEDGTDITNNRYWVNNQALLDRFDDVIAAARDVYNAPDDEIAIKAEDLQAAVAALKSLLP